MSSRAIVTGGAGVIGQCLVERLVDQQHTVRVIDLLPRPAEMSSEVDYVQGDLVTLGPSVIADFEPHTVYHLAAAFERSEEAPEFWQENAHHNVSASTTVLEGARQASTVERYVFASSYLIYDSSSYLFGEPCDTATRLDEFSPVNPRNVCGAAKLLHEREIELASASESGRFSAIAARIYRVYGRGSRDVISRWIRTALAGGTIRVYGPESRFDYVLADDVAEGLVRLGGTQEVGIVNLASGRARTIGEVLACIETQIAGVTIDGPYPAPEYESSEASLDRLTDILGWRPPTSLEHGIGELVAYERECIRTSTTSRRVLPPRRTNVMISSLSRKASIAEAVRAAYGALNIEGTIWGSDARSDPPALGHVDHLWHTAPLDKLTDDEIVSFCELEAIAVLIPTRDGELARFAGLRERLDDIGTFVPIGDPESVRIADDKLEFARVCSNAGLRAVPAATALDPSFGGRLVVKPRSGAGSKNSLIGIGREAAADALSANSDFVVQPYVTGVEYSVDIYIRRDGSCLGAVARERRDVVAGESIVTAVVDNAELRNLALECATAVGIRGHAVIQLIASGDGVQLLECNSRVGGASSAAWAAGLRSVDAMILESLGERPPDASPNTSLTVTRLPRDMLSWK